MTRHLVWRRYKDDLGTNWAVHINSEEAAIAALGWTVTVHTDKLFPNRWRRRYIRLVDSAGGRRRVVAATTAATAWVTNTTSLSLRRDDGTLVTYSIVGYTGEERRRMQPY